MARQRPAQLGQKVYTDQYREIVQIHNAIPKRKSKGGPRRIRKDKEYLDLLKKECGLTDEWAE